MVVMCCLFHINFSSGVMECLPAGLTASGMSGRHSNAPYILLNIEAPYGCDLSPPS